MKYKSNPYHEVRLYIGSREHYNGPTFVRESLLQHIANFQHEHGLTKCNPVRVTETIYVWDDYAESGWEVAVIAYPRQPKSVKVLDKFMLDLAEYLLKILKQNRISVVFPDEIVMLEADDAEDKK